MVLYVSQSIISFSLVSMILGTLKNQYKPITELALVSNIITFFALISLKSFTGLLQLLSLWLLMPLGIFCFLLLVKNILLVFSANLVNEQD